MAEVCITCGKPFDEDGDWAGECYECFSKEADRKWWEMMSQMLPTGEPDEYVRIGATCPVGGSS